MSYKKQMLKIVPKKLRTVLGSYHGLAKHLLDVTPRCAGNEEQLEYVTGYALMQARHTYQNQN